MGVCILPEDFQEIIDYDGYMKIEEEKESKKKERIVRYINSQRIISVNKFKIEKIKKQNLLKKKTHDKKFHIVNSDSILLLNSTKKNLAKTETNNQSDSRLFFSPTIKSKYDIINYPKDVHKLINDIRKDPKSFVEKVESAIPFIQKHKDKLIYNGNVRVYLNKGQTMFSEAIKCLNDTKPMGDLILNEDISIDLPNDNEYNTNENFFKNKILSERKIKKIERYYREAIKDPYTGVLMMIVDDTSKNQGEKRKTILDPNLKKLGIKCRFYGNKFLAYLTFGK